MIEKSAYILLLILVFGWNNHTVFAQSIEFIGTLEQERIENMKNIARLIPSINSQFLGVDSTYTYANALEIRKKQFPYNHDIEVYKIIYSTTYFDSTIQASGLIIIPKTQRPIPIMVYHHGTLLPCQNGAAPSQTKFKNQNEVKNPYIDFFFCSHWASLGCAIFMPDYIGYGESKDVEHPYCSYPPEAKSTFEMLSSGHDFVVSKIEWNGQLVVSGISEGALQGLGFHAYITRNHAETYPNIISHLFAGPYQLNFNTFNFSKDRWSPLQKIFYTWAFYYHLYYKKMSIVDYIGKNYKSSREFCNPKFMLFNLKPEASITPKGLEYILNLETDPLNSLTHQLHGKVRLYHGLKDMVVATGNTWKTASILRSYNTTVDEIYFDEKGHITGMYTYFDFLSNFIKFGE